ncbi:MAG: response regulator [Candidatus Marinimicrobia bacterium]|nr:response regulator [Candidatus Neomarinimicrobiota bacterium]
MPKDFEEKSFNEISESLCRYLKQTGRLEEECYILYLGENAYEMLCNCNRGGESVNTPNAKTEIEKFIEEKVFTASHPIYIIGFEPDPSKNDEAILDKPGYASALEFRFFHKVFPELVGYVGAPFDPQYAVIHDAKKLTGKNFGGIKNSLEDILSNRNYEKIKNTTLKDVPKSWVEVFTKLGRYFDTEIEGRERIFHDAGGQGQGKMNLLIQLANMFAGIIRLKLARHASMSSEGNYDAEIKLLLIDNNPGQFLANMDERYKFLDMKLNEVFLLFKPVIKTYIFDGNAGSKDFKWFLKDLKERKENKKSLSLPCKKCSEGASFEETNIEEFDAILVDMYLNSGQPDGLEILHQLTEVYPQIPAFVLSVSDDFALIRRAIQRGADYYIIKNQVFSVPYVLWDYIRSIGEILEHFGDTNGDTEEKVKLSKEYYKNLLGSIRYWHFKKNLLWFGDKCYHMIEHSFDHTLDDWKHLNQVVVPLISKRNKKEFFKKCRDGEKKELTDDLLYSFCMATWLHDIGHKGTTHYGDPHLIRDNHGYIAGELILKYPEVFRIKDKDDYYKELDFSKVSAVEALYRRKEITKKEKLTISEMIALIAIYHKSNAPIDQESFHRLWSNPRKRIPLDYYKNKEPKYENILTLEKILEERDSERKERILTLTALFRFIDSIDLRVIRVGDITERELKKIVIENDKKYQYYKLAREVKSLSRHYTETTAESALFVKSFYDDPIDEIEKGEFVSLGLSKELIKDPEILANYESLIDYAAFIALQPDHFDLHSSVKEMRFEYIGDSHLSITLITDKDEEWLNEHKVRERGSEKQTIYDRLIGEDNYIFREIKDVRKYLKCFFSQITVMLMHESGKQYGKKHLDL